MDVFHVVYEAICAPPPGPLLILWYDSYEDVSVLQSVEVVVM